MTESPHQHAPDPHGHQHPHHTADPAALEDPVHHDVAVHELEVEAESDEEEDPDTEDPDGGPAAGEANPGAGPDGSGDRERDPLGEELLPQPAEAAAWEAVDSETEPSGDPRVDAAVGRLAEVRGTPTAGHVEVYEDVHRRLQDTLTDLDGS